MAFEDVRLPEAIARGATGGPLWATTVIVTASGAEQRIAQWSEPRRAWDVSHALRNNTQRDELIAFFVARMGRLHSFRFKDWSDYQVTEKTDLTLLTTTTFQLVKEYTSGSITRLRTLTKPVAATVQIWNGATEITAGFTLAANTGIITFAGAPGYLPAWTGEFDCEVRFDTDSMQFSQEEITYGTWGSCPLVEVKG